MQIEFRISVADPHHRHHPAFYFYADPDPTFHFDADPDTMVPFTLMRIRILPFTLMRIRILPITSLFVYYNYYFNVFMVGKRRYR